MAAEEVSIGSTFSTSLLTNSSHKLPQLPESRFKVDKHVWSSSCHRKITQVGPLLVRCFSSSHYSE